MKKTLVASAMAVAFGISGAAFASSTNQTTGRGDNAGSVRVSVCKAVSEIGC